LSVVNKFHIGEEVAVFRTDIRFIIHVIYINPNPKNPEGKLELLYRGMCTGQTSQACRQGLEIMGVKESDIYRLPVE